MHITRYWDAYIFMYIVLAILAAMAAFVVFVFGYVIYNKVGIFFAPTKRTWARVVRKRHKQWDASVPTQGGAIGMAFMNFTMRKDNPEITLAEGTDCYITFNVNGKEMEFAAPEALYIEVEPDMQGLLVYKGEKLKYFIRKNG